MKDKHPSEHGTTGSSGMGGHSMPSLNEGSTKALKIITWLTGIYFVIELGIGVYTGSVSVISDAFHTFSAVGGVLLALIAGRLAMRPADKYKTFGSFRAEILGALLNGFFLLIMAFIVLYMGYMRLQNPIELATTPMLLAAGGGLITEIISIKLLYARQKTNLNLKGAFWHVLQTFVGSIIIIVAALVIKFTGFLAIDPILGMLFGLVLIYASWHIIKRAFNILLESVPQDVDIDKIKDALLAIPGVVHVHHIHAWMLTSGKNIFSSHIRVNDLSKHHIVLRTASKILREEFGFYFSTLQIAEEGSEYSEAEDIDITREGGANGSKNNS